MTTFYVYRAQDYTNYANENINVADLAGVLFYLQNEVVRTCPRKFNVTRIRRMKMTINRNLLDDFVAFDSAKCTVMNCGAKLQASHYAVGCQTTPAYCGKISGFWYSLPGPCPDMDFKQKTPQCRITEPGSSCGDVGDAEGAIGSGTCMYHIEDAGELELDALVGIIDYGRFCYKQHQLEYNNRKDGGDGNITFWDGIAKPQSCQRRMEKISRAFKKKYPDLPQDLDKPSMCRR